eukprot:jgi/Tetstr1/453557/TSEL_040525.t1
MAPPVTLPYGPTLHYAGCGCTWGWRNAGQAADQLDQDLLAAFSRVQDKSVVPARRLTVAYMLPHHNITGGMKCLVEHIRLLQSRGHITVAVHRSESATRAMPPWTEVEADHDVICNLRQRLNDVYDVHTIDVVVVAELLLGVPAPILYWEQGHEWLFGDPVRFQAAHNYLEQDQLFHMAMHLPVALASVSTAVQDILKQEFRRESLLLPNSIDCERFRPGPKSGNWALAGVPAKKRKVLLVGNPTLQLKGFDVAIAVLQAVNCVIPIHVTWICQVEPTVATLPSLAAATFEMTYVVKPKQEDLPALYRGHDLFLFTSHYEAWGMPVMEAMASGLAVVTTNCLGVMSFAQDGSNCMLANTNDAAACARLVVQVLNDGRLRSKLQRNARATALRFTPKRLLDQLESILYALVSQRKSLFQIRKAAWEQIRGVCLWASRACSSTHSPAPERRATTPGSTDPIMQRIQLLMQPQLQGGAASASLGVSPSLGVPVAAQAGSLQQLSMLHGWHPMQAAPHASWAAGHLQTAPQQQSTILARLPPQQVMIQPCLAGVACNSAAGLPRQQQQLHHLLHSLWLHQQQPPL